jgi:glycosyltransferase involved in cell wall biosynthesis
VSRMHVLIVPSWYPLSEAPTKGIFFKEQAQALNWAGVRVGVVYPEMRSLRTLDLAGVCKNHFQRSFNKEDGIPTCRIHGWNVPCLRVRARLWVGLATYLVDLYVERFGRPDLLHAHSILWGGYVAMLAGQRYGLPYLVTEHSSAYVRGLILPWQELFIEECLGKAARVIAVSHGLAASLKEYLRGKTAEVIPNVVDTAFFTLPPRPRSARTFKFLVVALLTSTKGIDVLIRAFAQAFRDDSNVCLEVGGDGPQRVELEAVARTLGVARQVQFLGLLSRDQVREAMWRANVFVLPSRKETFGVVSIEALATGLPVIATRSGGPEEIVRTEVGCLAEPDDEGDLARCLREVYQNYSGFYVRDAEIRDYAVKCFGKEAVTGMLIEHYSRVLEGETA